ncbi:hypothetical protein [Azospirillum brasilense]|uniref:hypothetical protein n=1 Tax=Azospirillum brasilense TaxID=192 RepID=UPI000E696436|nr:hypothetical protein [Azospirillum brasilense]NUB25444.1 hypothetical protein [Azospirillum brasilense]NUB29959.1 hypothetical protein [Azospirillum brasilense]RIW05469.1 hypothetical protein D2T81_08310 [Azospirillum brasilense]
MVHLHKSLESEASKAAEREGRSLDQFVNEAVEEKLRHAQRSAAQRHVTPIRDRGAPLDEDAVERA